MLTAVAALPHTSAQQLLPYSTLLQATKKVQTKTLQNVSSVFGLEVWETTSSNGPFHAQLPDRVASFGHSDSSPPACKRSPRLLSALISFRVMSTQLYHVPEAVLAADLHSVLNPPRLLDCLPNTS